MIYLLNKEQQQAVEANDRFIFLLAGAGSGKTTVLISRVKRLIESGVNEKDMLLISFTRKSAQQLKARLGLNNQVTATTFHGLCYQLLRTIREVSLVTEDELIKASFSKEEIMKIGLNKQFNKNRNNELNKRYDTYLQEKGLMDFIDLEQQTLNAFNDNRFCEVKNFHYIFIDEFQDTSLVQFELLKCLIQPSSHVFCVGDPDQSIYAFRGASKEVIDHYIKTYQATRYTLFNNYRSKAFIIKYANRLIDKNPKRLKKELHGIKKEQGSLSFKSYETTFEQMVTEEVGRFYSMGYQPHEVVVLYRSHHQVAKLINQKSGFRALNTMSIHQSKGLEFPCVLVVGLEKHQFPLKDEPVPEERRLFFVAMTRAEEHLVLFFPKQKKKRSLFYEDLLR